MPKIKLQNKVNGCRRGMSILEILVAVGLILLICVPTIQIVYSLQSKYISEIVQNEPISISQKYSNPNFQSILAQTYHGDGSIRTVFKKGGMREVDIIAQDRIFNRNICPDFTKINIHNISPKLYLYSSSDLNIPESVFLTGLSFVGNSLLASADSASTTLPDVYSFTVDTLIYSSTSPFTKPALYTDNSLKPNLSMTMSENTGPGASYIQSSGMRVIVSNTGVKNQASVFKVLLDTDSSADRSIVNGISKAFDLIIPGSNSSTTPITKVILYAHGKIFLGTEKSVLPEISVFNAYTGQFEQSIEVGYGINDMLIVDDLLIVAGPRDPEIEVFSISTMSKVGEYDLPSGSGNAKVLNIFGDNLYVGRTKGGDEFTVLKISRQNQSPVSPFSPIFTPVFKTKIKWSIDSILKSDEYTMLFTADDYFEFQIFERTGDGVDITNAEHVLRYKMDLPDRVSNVACMKNAVWMTFKNTDGSNPYKLGVLVF
jgi:hypothetical protein